MVGRAPRPKTVRVPPDVLFDRWEPFAKLRDAGFEWDGSTYGKPSRALSSDESGLIRHAGALRELLQLAPTGFPAQSSVRDALLKLHASYKVFSCDERMAYRQANDAANVWRIMSRLLRTKEEAVRESECRRQGSFGLDRFAHAVDQRGEPRHTHGHPQWP